MTQSSTVQWIESHWGQFGSNQNILKHSEPVGRIGLKNCFQYLISGKGSFTLDFYPERYIDAQKTH